MKAESRKQKAESGSFAPAICQKCATSGDQHFATVNRHALGTTFRCTACGHLFGGLAGRVNLREVEEWLRKSEIINHKSEIPAIPRPVTGLLIGFLIGFLLFLWVLAAKADPAIPQITNSAWFEYRGETNSPKWIAGPCPDNIPGCLVFHGIPAPEFVVFPKPARDIPPIKIQNSKIENPSDDASDYYQRQIRFYRYGTVTNRLWADLWFEHRTNIVEHGTLRRELVYLVEIAQLEGRTNQYILHSDFLSDTILK